jgi:hypothetical protein
MSAIGAASTPGLGYRPVVVRKVVLRIALCGMLGLPYLTAAEADCDDAQVMAVWEKFCGVRGRSGHLCRCAAMAVSIAKSTCAVW